MPKDHQRERMRRHLPGKPSDPGRTGVDNRRVVEAVLRRAGTGVPRRDLPDSFGNWNSVFTRFSRCSGEGVRDRLFSVKADEPDFEYVMIDSAIVGAHRHAAGKKGGLKRVRSAARGVG